MIWDILHHWDQILTLAINSFHAGFSDNLMILLSRKEVWFPMYAIIVLFLFHRLGFKKGLIVLITVGLTIGACDQTSNLVKDAVGRLRPCYSSEMIFGGLHILEWRGNHFGFFSAHAANSFGLAMACILGFNNDSRHKYQYFQIGMMVWAALVSISRIFVGKHYLGDVLVGTLIGLFYGYLFGKLGQWLISKMNLRLQ